MTPHASPGNGIIEQLKTFRASWQGDEAALHRLLKRYYLASCRRIWKILPIEESRRIVEVAELQLAGEASEHDLSDAEWEAEGAAVLLYNEDLNSPIVEGCLREVELMPSKAWFELVGSPAPETREAMREVLGKAAYMVVIVACYPNIDPIDNVEKTYGEFLSPALWKEMAPEPLDPRM